MAIVQVGAGELQARLQAAEQPVVIDVWAPWCGPCRAMEPHLATVSSEYAGRVEVWKLNADENPEAVRALKIFGIPTTIVYRQGVEVMRRTGSQNTGSLRALFDDALAEQAPQRQASGPADTERTLRLAVALALLVLAAFTGWPVVLLLIAAGVFFSAIHDRCPIWQGIKARLASSTPG
jgi:thioredoxin